MENENQNPVLQNLPPQPAAPASSSAENSAPLKKYESLSLTEKAKIYKKRYEYINGQKMAKFDAENAARKDFGVEQIAEEGRAKFDEPNQIYKLAEMVGLVAIGKKLFDKTGAKMKEKVMPKVEEVE